MFIFNPFFDSRIFGTLSAIVFGYFVRNYYISSYKTKKIENVQKKIIPYENKYNQKFDNAKLNNQHTISSIFLNQKVASLKEQYKLDIYTFQSEYSEIESLYLLSNVNDDSYDDDDDDISNDEDAIFLKDKINKLKTLMENEDQIKQIAFNQCLLDKKIELMKSLQNNFILENTPTGNVIMTYNSKKEGFSYYSDKTISNKYLESVCKKYCIQFKCKLLFNTVYINEGKLSNFKFLKNEIRNKNKKNAKLSFRSFKEQYSLF